MKKIFVAGHNGMVGRALCNNLIKLKEYEVITIEHSRLDLCDQALVADFIREAQPDEIIIAAAKVGGIHANMTYPAEFIYQNLQIQNNIIHQAHVHNVQKLLFLGSSCIYPKDAKQPMTEECLLSGPLEQTNEPYAVAKIAGIKMCQSYSRQYGRDYRSVMPTNLYGPGDNYHPDNSHVVPGLINRFHLAKINSHPEVEVWGSGKPKREFLYVDDMAEACILLHKIDRNLLSEPNREFPWHINIGSGLEISIADLAMLIQNVVGYSGKIVFNQSKPDGAIRKLLDNSILENLGWVPKTKLFDGLENAYRDFLKENHTDSITTA